MSQSFGLEIETDLWGKVGIYLCNLLIFAAKIQRMIRSVKQQDIHFMADIYNEYVMHGTATFEEAPLSEEEMNRRVMAISGCFPCLVCEIGESVVGYCYAHFWKEYGAYKTYVGNDGLPIAGLCGKRYRNAIDERIGRRVSQTGIQGADCLHNRW